MLLLSRNFDFLITDDIFDDSFHFDKAINVTATCTQHGITNIETLFLVKEVVYLAFDTDESYKSDDRKMETFYSTPNIPDPEYQIVCRSGGSVRDKITNYLNGKLLNPMS